MADLDRNYIEEHLIGVHSYESWARAFIEKALKELKVEIGTDSVPEKEIEVKLKISANTKGCITICGFGICIHAG